MFRRAIPLAFASVTLIFLLATGASQLWALSIDPRAREIALVAAPSVRHLAAAAMDLRHVQALLTAPGSPGARRTDEVRAARRALDLELAAYLELPTTPREQVLWGEVRDDLRELDLAIGDALARPAALEPLSRFKAAADRMSVHLERPLAGHAEVVRLNAVEIQRLRDRTLALLLGLDGVGVVATLGAAVVVGRGVEQHVFLQEANANLLREQVAELEAFAGRVAHDVLGPLGGVSLALELARRSTDAEQRAGALERGRACVGTVDRVVRGLLEFARSGAHPDPGGRADVRAVVSQVLANALVDAQAAEVQLRAELPDDLPPAACADGVLVSLAANLVRNAIKHMGAGARREVVVSARESDGRVRVEVVDTGPGLAPDFVAVAFQPHVRGRGAAVPGLGLGLATVKRLAEAHGGRVGVVSAPGSGSTFWFELPRAAV